MRRIVSWLSVVTAVGLWAGFASHHLWAYPATSRALQAACAACHVNPAGGADLTDAGKAIKADTAAKVPGDVKGAEYVGANKCRVCHIKQHKAWQETKHAKAMEGLRKADPKVVADLSAALKVEVKGAPAETDGCVECHVTGFRLPGGYPAADSTRNANLANVTCEACHGPGSKHVAAKTEDRKKTINRAVSAGMCQQCHKAATSPKFNFEEYRKTGVHAVKAG